MKKVTSKNITPEQIEMVNKRLGYNGELTNHGYAFYYNQMFVHDLSLCDADRYANLNTVLGYDVGLTKFRSLDGWLWEHRYDLMELNGSDEDKKMLQRATQERNTKELDYSKWRNLSNTNYTYSYFEDGKEFK